MNYRSHQLHNIAKKCNLKISTSKIKSMGICDNETQILKMIEGKSLNKSWNLSI